MHSSGTELLAAESIPCISKSIKSEDLLERSDREMIL